MHAYTCVDGWMGMYILYVRTYVQCVYVHCVLYLYHLVCIVCTRVQTMQSGTRGGRGGGDFYYIRVRQSYVHNYTIPQ